MSEWPKEIFEEHPELFLTQLEDRTSQSSREADQLLEHLGQEGFDPHRLLDLNCGIGRHAIELAKKGIQVVGTDISPRYLEIGTKRAEDEKVGERTQFKVSDMRDIASVLEDEEPFDGVINMWTSFGFYDEITNQDILRQCRVLVKEGGFLAVDIINRDWLIKNFQPRYFEQIGNMIFLENRGFDLENSRSHSEWTYLKKVDEKTYELKGEFEIDLRVWSLHELIELFEETGWKFRQAYPGSINYQENIPLREARQLLVIGRKE